MRIVGILLAAGTGSRFGGGKLLAALPAMSGDAAAAAPIGAIACRHMIAALPETVAVVRTGDDALAGLLEAEGARVVRCVRADEGMGASLACGVAAASDADGWVVALADMPWIAVETIARVAAAIADGATVAAPFVRGVRGHPVGFAAALRDALVSLGGDEGARDIVNRQAHGLVRVDVDDGAILRDVDTPADLVAGAAIGRLLG